MNKSELVAAMAAQCGMTKADTEKVLDAFMDQVAQALGRGAGGRDAAAAAEGGSTGHRSGGVHRRDRGDGHFLWRRRAVCVM